MHSHIWGHCPRVRDPQNLGMHDSKNIPLRKKIIDFFFFEKIYEETYTVNDHILTARTFHPNIIPSIPHIRLNSRHIITKVEKLKVLYVKRLDSWGSAYWWEEVGYHNNSRETWLSKATELSHVMYNGDYSHYLEWNRRQSRWAVTRLAHTMPFHFLSVPVTDWFWSLAHSSSFTSLIHHLQFRIHVTPANPPCCLQICRQAHPPFHSNKCIYCKWVLTYIDSCIWAHRFQPN